MSQGEARAELQSASQVALCRREVPVVVEAQHSQGRESEGLFGVELEGALGRCFGRTNGDR